MILNDEEIIKNYTYSFDRVLLKLGEYELVCLNKKLPFQNNFNINFKDFNKVFYNLKTNIDIFNFIHNLQDLVLSNKLDSCIDKTFFKEKIVNLEINIKKNFEENVKLLKDILLKKINKINQFTNIYSFSFLQSKDNKFYDVIDFFKYFSFFFFLLIIQRIILSKIFK